MRRKFQLCILGMAVLFAAALHAQSAETQSLAPVQTPPLRFQSSEPIGPPTLVTHVSHVHPMARSLSTTAEAPVPVTTLTGAGLTITPTFDASVDASTQTVINNEITLYQNTFSTPITVAIYFYGMSSGLGQSTTWVYSSSYSTFRAGLVSNASSGDDALALANTASGSTNPVNGGSNISFKSANGRAIGLSTPGASFNFANSPCPTFTGDSCIGINITLANSLGVLASTVEHEMDEVLGLGSALNGTATPATPAAEDLFRWASAGVRSYSANTSTTQPCTSTAAAYFSIDGGTTDLVDFNNCNNGGDYGDWTTHTPSQIQDAFTNASSSPALTRTSSETRALDVIGYTLAKKRRGGLVSQ